MQVYVGQKLKHCTVSHDKLIVTVYSIHKIDNDARTITLETLETTGNPGAVGFKIPINDFTIFNMLQNGSMEVINDNFEIET